MKSSLAVTLAVVLGSSWLAVTAGCGSDEALPIDAATVDASTADAASCGGLDLATCRRTAGCAADLCPGCGCDLSYRGCLAASEVPASCPALDCPSFDCCRMMSDCTGGSCVSPGDVACGGACNPQPDECTRDQDCNNPAGAPVVRVCDPVACSCSGAHACVPGCVTSDDCGDGETCTPATGRCAPSACGAGTPCPLDFDCVTGACQRRTCANDVACDGFCVDGACHGGLGVCHAAVP